MTLQSKDYIEQNKNNFREFIRTHNINLFYSGYVQMVNILYNECLLWLRSNVDAYVNMTKEELNDKTKVYQCRVFSDYLKEHGLPVEDDSKIKNIGGMRNKLVHDKRAVMSMLHGRMSNFTSYDTIHTLSLNIYIDDSCTNFLQKASLCYINVKLDGTPESSNDVNSDELPDIIGRYNNGREI